MKCSICEEYEVEDGTSTCSRCWYGMRLAPKDWKKDMKKLGIKIERGMGCNPMPWGFICGDPYRRKKDAPAS